MLERSDDEFNIWPCFVDALSSLLIVIIFVLLGFFLSQTYLSTMLNDTDTSLKNLQSQYETAQKKLAQSQVAYQECLRQIEKLNALLGASQKAEMQLKARTVSLTSQIQELMAKLELLNQALAAAKKDLADKEVEWKNNKEAAIQEKLDQIMHLQEEIKKLKTQIPEYILKNPDLLRYRSEFFGSLQDILGGRSDIRVVGDRFVFQAEVLFEKGSAELGKNGQRVLDTLATVLKELIKKIPADISWILRIDGHTDRLPIHNDVFKSNWELSSARATSVVKYLISKGIPPKRLAAAGFAEYYPLTKDESQMSKNRRIEFRFDYQQA